MASSDNGGRSGSIGFLGLLGILFIGLRLAGVIDWPWWVALSPLWGGAMVWVAAVAILCACAVRDEAGGRKWKR